MSRSAGSWIARAGGPALVSALLVPVLAAAPARADVATSCDPDGANDPSASPGRTLESLRIPQVQDWFTERGRVAGAGVVVAVLDSGVSTTPFITPTLVPHPAPAAGRATTEFFQGTTAAGIIAGAPQGDPSTRIGIAPGASILDVKIYDNVGSSSQEGDALPSAQTLVTGLRYVLSVLPTIPVKIVNLTITLPDDPLVKSLVKQLWKKGVILVAPSGDRASIQDTRLNALHPEFQNGENAVDDVFPAGYSKVVAATTTTGGLEAGPVTDYALQSSAIVVAVPTSGAPGYGLDGQTCSVRRPSTRWAAAEVSGVLAVLASAFPDHRPAQLVSRLVNTTDGRSDLRTPLVGAGLVQPYEALTRSMTIARNGTYDSTEEVVTQQTAEAPAPRTDPLAGTRDDLAWFGLLGGGVLVLALVLRPVLARRRRTN
jgi:membrane-anchored mycosin MYCP